MRIHFESVGGFTGPAGKEVIDIDTGALASGEGDALVERVARIPPAVWGARLLVDKPRSSDFRQRLSVEEGDGAARTVEFHDRAAPAELIELVQALRARRLAAQP